MKNKLSLLILLIIIVGLFCGCGSSSSEESKNNNKSEETSNLSGEMQEQEVLETENMPSSDLEIITREGHPTYYGSVEVSHAIWDGIDKETVIFADSYNKYKQGKTILYMSAYRNSDLIRDIGIYFSNFEEPVGMTLEDVLIIAASYMPFGVMDDYYEFKDSELIVPDDGVDKDTYYVVSYRLTEEGKSAYYSNEHEYSGTIDVIIAYSNEGVPQNISIGFGTPRWMSSLSTNGYHKEEWDCDLYDYKHV